MKPKTRLPEPETTEFADPDVAARLTRRFGLPWSLDDRNQIMALNADWWAGLIVSRYNFLHDEDEGFFIYDPLAGIYEKRTGAQVRSLVRDFLFHAARDAQRGEILEFKKRPFVVEVVELIQGQSEVESPFLHTEPRLALQNGILCFSPSGRVRLVPFDPEYRYRYVAPAKWDPDAECPRFLDEYLSPMLPEEDDRDLLQRQLGLALFRMNPAQRMVLLEGESSGGKTTLANLVIEIIGQETCCQLRTEHLDKQFEMDSFRGRSLLLGNDVGEDFFSTLGAQTLKGLTSTDLFHPEAKNRRDRRPLRGPFNVVIGTNCRLQPREQGDAGAWRRRLVVYDCQSPSGRKRIRDFSKLLMESEGAGIVAWLVRGAQKAIKEINAGGDYVLTDEQLARVDRLILRTNPVNEFAEGYLVPADGETVTAEEVYDAFLGYCRVSNLTPIPIKTFGRFLERKILEEYKRGQSHDIARDGKKVRGWRGLKIVDPGWRLVEKPEFGVPRSSERTIPGRGSDDSF